MPLQRNADPRRAATLTPLSMIGSMVRSVVIPIALALAMAACSTPGSSSSWSYGPTLEPAASASAAPSAAASAAPSASAAPLPSASAMASAGPSASAGASGAPAGDATQLTIGTRTGAETEFEPDEPTVQAGGVVAVTFENLSTLPHNLTFGAPISVATKGVVAPGASETIEFPASPPGDYTFVCTIHAGMQGTLTVEAAG